MRSDHHRDASRDDRRSAGGLGRPIDRLTRAGGPDCAAGCRLLFARGVRHLRSSGSRDALSRLQSDAVGTVGIRHTTTGQATSSWDDAEHRWRRRPGPAVLPHPLRRLRPLGPALAFVLQRRAQLPQRRLVDARKMQIEAFASEAASAAAAPMPVPDRSASGSWPAVAVRFAAPRKVRRLAARPDMSRLAVAASAYAPE